MGDIAGNLAKARAARAAAGDADIILFSELFITGYPPRTWSEAGVARRGARSRPAFAKDTASGPRC